MTTGSSRATSVSRAVSDLVCDATSVADTVLPSVVTISAEGADGSAGTGTGEIFAEGGYVLTNQHVIADAGDGGRIVLVYTDGTRTTATLVGEDVATDLAVLRADDGAEGRPVIALGSSADLEVGRPVVALGAPMGLSSTVTTGVVSALGRYVPVPNGSVVHHLVDAIQTDAAVNPGNSGGPLVDCDGALIGVNAAIATVPNADGVSGGGSVGLGFAIPVGVAEPVAEQLMTTGSANHPVVGLAAHAVTAADGSPAGLLVSRVASGGPADAAGLRVGDVITAVDGAVATTADQLVVATLTRSAGDVLPLTVERDGASQDVDLVLAR
ncbi:trypsin-like peptidase domain-containing protein [Nocardioides sp. GY 10127]|uniref:S1C family serine protease n=1 Tax=Nocardioides sp. GY 10127 TaxID=2569762 RepID=UPI00197EDF13|nr:trypsin-like peptidase domain-containing protein [Nocardioides sp. GY 10127]